MFLALILKQLSTSLTTTVQKKVTRGSSSHHHVILYNQFWNNSAAYRQADLMVGRVRCSVGKGV